ncbi:MAG: GNAT family protein [Bacteroidota bacterium]
MVRSWEEHDAGSLARYANNRNVWINVRDTFPFPYTGADARAYLASVCGASPETHFAVATGGEAIGGIGFQMQADVYRLSAELGYWLGEPFWGKGIASCAVEKVLAYAFGEFPLSRMFAGVFEWNPASSRVLEKAGFTLEGRFRKCVYKNGQVIDQLMYGMTAEEFRRRGA